MTPLLPRFHPKPLFGGDLKKLDRFRCHFRRCPVPATDRHDGEIVDKIKAFQGGVLSQHSHLGDPIKECFQTRLPCRSLL